MLILTRDVDESMKIGDEITLKILEVNGNQIKMGINAPKHVNVLRQEIVSGEDSHLSSLKDEESQFVSQQKPQKTVERKQKQAEGKKSPSSNTRIYHKDEKNISIIDTIIIKCDGKEKHGLWLENCSNVIIENIQVLRSELACLRMKNCHHITLKNCLFEGSIKAQGIQIINSFAIKLENVTCQKNANIGIDIQGSYDISIISSSLLNNVKAGLEISDGNHVTIKKSTFDDSSQGQGIKISNAFVINLENITCRNNANAGVEIQMGSHDISIIASEWFDNARAGLRLLDSYKVSCRDLKLNQTQDGNGIWFREGQHIEFVNCHFDNNHYSGIHLESCSDVVFTNTTFSENKTKNGIYLKEVENAQFQYCQFNKNRYYGLVLFKSENISILNSKIHFNKKGYGNITKSVVEIMDCDIRGKSPFKLCERSSLKTNLEERSHLKAIFWGPIFKKESQSQSKKPSTLIVILLLLGIVISVSVLMITDEKTDKKPTPINYAVNPQNTTGSKFEPSSITTPNPVEFVNAYYDDINNNNVASVIRKWKLPDEDKLRRLIEAAEWLKINNIQLIHQNVDKAEVSIDVSGQSKVDTTEQRWLGTIMLENVAGNWKIIEMRLSRVKR